jgi:DNA-binding CsgD family transcriptional regulator
MTSGYEEWAAARTPSLLAFASALTEDDELARAAVARALARLRPAWARAARDDPDIEARRMVARACTTPRRAAAVLRLLEGRSDAEIAEVLGCSESAARRHVHRGRAEMDQSAGEAVAESARDVLIARASAPTQPSTYLPDASTVDRPSRRHRGVWLAALAVVALVVGVTLVSHQSRSPAGVITYRHVDVPESWRHESYAGVELQVPDTWGWGGSPLRSSFFPGPRHLGACGTTQAAVLPPDDASTYVSPLNGFVGRPAVMDRRCVTWGADGSLPTGQAVWFDSPLPLGVKPGGSVVAETRGVGEQHVTVFSDDRDLRRQILGSAEQVDVDGHGCPTRPVVRPTRAPGDLEPTSMSVCIYSQDTGIATLMWSGTVPRPRALAYAEAVSAAGDDGTQACPTPTGRWVALRLAGEGGSRWDLVNLGCASIQLAGGGSAALTSDTVEPWAYAGATAYVSPPLGHGELEQYFQAPSPR